MSSAGKELHFTVNTADIVYLNAILDSYEGIGIMRTLDRKSGHIVIYTAMEKEVKKLLEYLSQHENISCQSIGRNERRGG